MLSDFSMFLVKLQNEALEGYMWLLFILGLSRRFQAYISHRSTLNLSAIKQKGESQNGCYKKQRTPNFRKINISFPLMRKRGCAYEGVKNVRFRKIWCALLSWYKYFEICSFALLPKNRDPVFHKLKCPAAVKWS